MRKAQYPSKYLARQSFIVAILVLQFICSLPVQAEKRIALLIANANYATDVGRLRNPPNDIKLLAQALAKIGFDVTTVNDADFATLEKEVRKHSSKLRAAGDGTIGLVYYSGHGASDEQTNTNYLIPTDVKSIDTTELWDGSVSVREVVDTLKTQAPRAMHFVILDACRNKLKLRFPGVKAVISAKGFLPMSVSPGILIAYSTAEGELASDGDGIGGPYAQALAAEIVKPGVEAITMFRNVQIRLLEQTGQEPWLQYGAVRPVWLAGTISPGNLGPLDISECPITNLVFVDSWTKSEFIVKKVGISYMYICGNAIGPAAIRADCKGPYGDTLFEGLFKDKTNLSSQPSTAYFVWSVIKGVPCCGWNAFNKATADEIVQKKEFKWLSNGSAPKLKDMGFASIQLDNNSTNETGVLSNPMNALRCQN